MELFVTSYGGLFHCRYVEVIVDGFIGDVWRSIKYAAEYFRLDGLNFVDVRYFSGTLEFNTVSPHRFY
jgi:hypothetical protein